MLIYRSEYFEIHFADGSSDYLLITFAPLNDYANGSNFWGKSFSKKASIATLGFIATGPNWYPNDAMLNALAHISPILSQWPKRLTYGASMGGYAALKYSYFLGATSAVSFAPQFSIDAIDVEKVYNPHHIHFNKDIHRNMKINVGDLCGRCLIFYDPAYKIDLVNAHLIGRTGESIHLVKMLNCHHEITRAFASTHIATLFLYACLEKTIVEIKALANQARKLSPIRGFSISERLLRSNISLSIKVFDATRSNLSERYVSTYIYKLLNCLNQGTRPNPLVLDYLRILLESYKDNTRIAEIISKAIVKTA